MLFFQKDKRLCINKKLLIKTHNDVQKLLFPCIIFQKGVSAMGQSQSVNLFLFRVFMSFIPVWYDNNQPWR